jgi:hypothetical protein
MPLLSPSVVVPVALIVSSPSSKIKPFAERPSSLGLTATFSVVMALLLELPPGSELLFESTPPSEHDMQNMHMIIAGMLFRFINLFFLLCQHGTPPLIGKRQLQEN